MENPSVADLVVQMHSNIDSIHQCVQSLSDTKAHDAEMEKLESDREARIASLHQAHQTEAEKLAEQRKKEEEDLAERRRIEEEELMERRRREDEERKARFEREEQERLEKKKHEDEAKERELEEKRRSVSEGVEAELERLEDEMERKVEDGKRALAELDKKRRAINAQIEAALNTPTVIPKINFRSRARTRGMSMIGTKVPNNETSKSSQPKEIATAKASEAINSPGLTNGHTDKPSEPTAEAMNQAPVEGPISEESEALEVSEAAPKEDVQNAEANLADSEIKSSQERGAIGKEAHLATEDPLHQEKGTESSSIEEAPASLDMLKDDIQSSSEATSTNASSNIDSEHISDTTPSFAGPANTRIEDDPFSVSNKSVVDEKEADHEIEEPVLATIDSAPIKEAKMEQPTASLSHIEPAEDATILPESPSEVVPEMAEERRDEQPSVSVSKIESEENTVEQDVSKEPDSSTVEITPAPVESQSSSEEPIAIEDSKTEEPMLNSQSAPVEKEVEQSILGAEENFPKSPGHSDEASSEPVQEEDEDVQATHVPEMKVEAREPAHEEAAAQVEEMVRPTEDSSAQAPTTPERANSEAEDLQTAAQEDVKPVVVEDPEDAKAKEEIAKLNAELMKAAMEEEATNQSLAAESNSEAATKDRGTDKGVLSPAQQEDISHHDTPEAYVEQLHEPEHTGVNQDHESSRDLPVENQEPQSPHEGSLEKIPTENTAKPTSDISDSAIDVQTPPHQAADDIQIDHEAHEPNGEKLSSNHDDVDLVTARVAEASTLPVAPGIAEDSEVSQHIEPENHDPTPPPAREDALDDKVGPKDVNAETEDPKFSSVPNHSQPEDSTVKDTQAREPHFDVGSDASTAPHEVETLARDHDFVDMEHSEGNPYEEEYDLLHNEVGLGEIEEGETKSHALESELPSHPRTRALSGAEDDGREFPRAESPVTVLNSDDLFEDDDEDQVEETTGHEVEAPRLDENGAQVRPCSQTPTHIDEVSNGEISQPAHSQDASKNELDLPLNKQHRISQEIHRTNSGKFASLVDAVRSDLPIVSHLVKEQEVQEIGMPGGGHFSDDILDEYDYETPEAIQRDEGDYIADFTDDFNEQENQSNDDEEARPSSPTLHIRTHTADTVPSFETYAQSDYSTPSTPETAISPPREILHNEPTIRQSWMHQGEELHHHESNEELKSAASPLQQAEFDPFNSQVYPSYVTPKSSLTNLQHDVEGSPGSYNSSPESKDNLQEAKDEVEAESQSPAQVQRPTLDTSRASPFSENRSYDSPRPYDSPISATRSLHSSSPSRTLFPTEQTPPPPPSRSPRRPTFPSPSSLAKTPVSSPSIPSSSFFQKTRSLFESSSRQDTPSTPPITRPRSIVFGVGKTPSSPSPPPKPSSLKSRPSSLSIRYGETPSYDPAPTSPEDELLVPKSLDGNGKPPSPAFSLPLGGDRGRSVEKEEDYEPRERRSSSFLDGISKLGGLVGLEGSIHNPNRAESRPLLGEGKEGNGY